MSKIYHKNYTGNVTQPEKISGKRQLSEAELTAKRAKREKKMAKKDRKQAEKEKKWKEQDHIQVIRF